MQFRCYSCGVVFSNGMPPTEALSIQQSFMVGVRPTVQHDLLWGTPYEGMSTANFCVFCLLAIENYPDAQFSKSNTPGHQMQFNGQNNLACECGYWMAYPIPMDQSKKNYRRNRQMVRHLVDVLYGDVSECVLDEFMDKEY